MIFHSIARLENLRCLSLGGNPLGVLPEAIFSLNNLKEFRPYNCELTELDGRYVVIHPYDMAVVASQQATLLPLI